MYMLGESSAVPNIRVGKEQGDQDSVHDGVKMRDSGCYAIAENVSLFWGWFPHTQQDYYKHVHIF